MIVKDSKGREVELTIIGCYEEPEIENAEYTLDPERELTDFELDWISEHYAHEISFEAFESQVAAAESAFEGDR